MGKINNYAIGTLNPGDKILASDAETGATKNVTPQEIIDLERSSNIYRAFLTQTSSSAPVATLVSGNTITGSWAYSATGTYNFVATSALGTNTAVVVSLNSVDEITYTADQTNSTTIQLKSYDAGVLTNALIDNLFIEITTYDL